MKKSEYRLGYRADIEGLRGIAILLVVAMHAGVPWLQGGFVGVDVFFVLSGFLITGLLVQETTTTGKLQFLKFYIRRLRRLLPALFLMLLVVSLLAALLLGPAEQYRQASAASMVAFWLSNIHFAFAHLDYFSPSAKTNLFLHTWSLGVEEQFYLVWPALLVWLLGRDGKRGMRRLKIGMWVVIIASLAACIVLTGKAQQLAFYMMPLRAWQFATGALIWLYFMVPAKQGRRLTNNWQYMAIGWLGLALIVFAGVWLDVGIAYPGAYALLPTIGAAAVIIVGCVGMQAGGVTRALSWRPLQWLGHVSYSWYLWHWPILLLGAVVVGSHAPGYQALWVVLSLLVACGSYMLVESPIRRQRYWLSRPRMAIFVALAIMVVANSLCLRWDMHATKAMKSPQYKRFVMAHEDAPIIYAMGCDDWYYSSRVHICAFGEQHAEHTAILIGDSHAGQWFPAVRKVFDRPGWRLLVLTKSACPIVDEPLFYKRIGHNYTKCAIWRSRALKDIAKIKPYIVLVASAIPHFTKKQWIEGTTKILAKLSPAVNHVYLFRDTPHLPFNGPNCLAEHAGRSDWLNLRHTCTAPFKSKHADLVAKWLQMAADKFHNVSMINMNQYICPNDTCAAERNDVIVFRDSQHLTKSFAATLAPELAQKLGMTGRKLSRR